MATAVLTHESQLASALQTSSDFWKNRPNTRFFYYNPKTRAAFLETLDSLLDQPATWENILKARIAWLTTILESDEISAAFLSAQKQDLPGISIEILRDNLGRAKASTDLMLEVAPSIPESIQDLLITEQKTFSFSFGASTLGEYFKAKEGGTLLTIAQLLCLQPMAFLSPLF